MIKLSSNRTVQITASNWSQIAPVTYAYNFNRKSIEYLSSFRAFTGYACLLYSEHLDVFSVNDIYVASAEVTFFKNSRSLKANIWITGYSLDTTKKHNKHSK